MDEGLSVDGNPIFTRHHSQIQLSGGAAFGLDWHIFALPVINERPGERAIQDIKTFFATMILIAPIPANMTGFSEEPSMELQPDAANYASCLRALLGQKPAAYSVFDSYVKTVIPDFSSIENVERGESGTQLIVKFEQQNPQRSLSVEFKALSDGEKCFFLSAYIIASNTVGSPVVLHVGRTGQPPFPFRSRPIHHRLAEDDQSERSIHCNDPPPGNSSQVLRRNHLRAHTKVSSGSHCRETTCRLHLQRRPDQRSDSRRDHRVTMNKYAPHVYVIPEDDRRSANRRRLRPPSPSERSANTGDATSLGAGLMCSRRFRDEYIQKLRDYPKAHVVMLIDFDDHVEQRRAEFEQRDTRGNQGARVRGRLEAQA